MRVTSQRARSSHIRRSASVAAARSEHCRSPRSYADHWNFVGGPPEEFARKRDVLHARCADIGRDPKNITLSAHVRLEPDLDYAKAVAEAGALGQEGLDLAIVYLPPPHTPEVLEPLAEAIRDSGLIAP